MVGLRFGALLFGLNLVPALEHVASGVGGLVTEHVGMAADELLVDGVERIVDAEQVLFRGHLREEDGLEQQVAQFFEELSKLIGKNLGADGPGVFVVPDLLQVKVVRKPAVPEHSGIDPFTKQPRIFKEKPASNRVKVVALKGLKKLV